MTIGIYAIRNIKNDKVYVGKSKNIEKRFAAHKTYLTKKVRPKQNTNNHLFNAVKKYGWESFELVILQTFGELDEVLISEAELAWMIKLKATENGNYNLRMDSSTGMIVHEKTRQKQSENATGIRNGNYGNKWDDEQKRKMSEIAKARHASGKFYGESYRKKLSINSIKMWSDLNKRKQMAKKVSISKRKFDFRQYHKSGEFIKLWHSVEEIVQENPDYKWQNIYAVCNGYKKSYMGFVWEKELKNEK